MAVKIAGTVMKKKILIMVVVAMMLMAMTCTMLVACGGLGGETKTNLPDSYEGMTKTDMNAYILFNEVYEYFLENKSYKRTQYYDFASKQFDMKIKTVRKLIDGKIYNEEVVIGKGLMSLNEGKRFYYDGSDASYIYFNDKKKVPGKGEGDKLYTVNSWTDYVSYDKGTAELEKEITSYESRMVTYDLSKEEYLASENDNSVYEKDGLYYFTLTVDTSDKAMNDVQYRVADEIANKTGGDPKDLKMRKNTTIQVCVEINGEVKRIKLLKTTEEYKGKIAVFSSECKQTYFNIFDYGKNANIITADDLLNLA